MDAETCKHCNVTPNSFQREKLVAMNYIFVLASMLLYISCCQGAPVKWRLVTLPPQPYLCGFDTFVPTVALIPSFDTIAAWVRNQSRGGGEIGDDIWDGSRWNETIKSIISALDRGMADEELASEVFEEVQDFFTGNSLQVGGDTEEDDKEKELEGSFDFSPLVQLCDLVPPACTSCNLSLIICSICCPSLFPSMLATPSNMTAHLETWLTASLWWSGLEPVLPREGLEDNLGQELSNIQIIHSSDQTTKKQLILGNDASIHQVCGYHTLRGERIVGGKHFLTL